MSRFFVSNFKWLMLTSGILTCTMFLAFISPQSSLQSNFGKTLPDELSMLIVRNWGFLIGLVGLMLIYGAMRESVRRFALVFGGSSKIAFIFLVVTAKEDYMNFGVGTAVIVDATMVALFITYLLLTRNLVKGNS
ncbi:MAG: hypothetical protein JNK10_11780 [Cyclobacteriaceae bacterium]|nr:hypothetical protein [Cyclobacteriaceae bacterium]